jgi:acid phosphatase type 7
VDVVVNGHDHDYERFAPQDPKGKADPEKGIREFVVGTGGGGLYEFKQIKPNSEVRNNRSYGVIKFTLRAADYSWEFVPGAGEQFHDSGTAACTP